MTDLGPALQAYLVHASIFIITLQSMEQLSCTRHWVKRWIYLWDQTGTSDLELRREEKRRMILREGRPRWRGGTESPSKEGRSRWRGRAESPSREELSPSEVSFKGGVFWVHTFPFLDSHLSWSIHSVSEYLLIGWGSRTKSFLFLVNSVFTVIFTCVRNTRDDSSFLVYLSCQSSNPLFPAVVG